MGLLSKPDEVYTDKNRGCLGLVGAVGHEGYPVGEVTFTPVGAWGPLRNLSPVNGSGPRTETLVGVDAPQVNSLLLRLRGPGTEHDQWVGGPWTSGWATVNEPSPEERTESRAKAVRRWSTVVAV